MSPRRCGEGIGSYQSKVEGGCGAGGVFLGVISMSVVFEAKGAMISFVATVVKVVFRSAASAISPGDLLKIKILSLLPRPVESEPLEAEFSDRCFSKPSS
jgi:hypothetical protein